jgi:hypothetical protein
MLGALKVQFSAAWRPTRLRSGHKGTVQLSFNGAQNAGALMPFFKYYTNHEFDVKVC